MENRKRKDMRPEEREEIYKDIEKGETNEFIANKYHISIMSVAAYRAWWKRNKSTTLTAAARV